MGDGDAVSAVRDSICRDVWAARRQVVYVRRMHIEHAAVIVEDYDSAIDFYVQALGFWRLFLPSMVFADTSGGHFAKPPRRTRERRAHP